MNRRNFITRALVAVAAAFGAGKVSAEPEHLISFSGNIAAPINPNYQFKVYEEQYSSEVDVIIQAEDCFLAYAPQAEAGRIITVEEFKPL